MKLPNAAAAFDHLVVVPSTGSTNADLVARAGQEPDFSVLVTADQTAGRGRLRRTWIAPPGKSLAISVLLRPRVPSGQALEFDHYGWLPLIAGAAMTSAAASVVPADEVGHSRVGLKWPNDVLIGGLKACGILAELVPSEKAVVIGAGINLSMTREELPTESSTSLELEGAALTGEELADRVLASYLAALRDLYRRFTVAGANATASGIHELVERQCSTIGRNVRVQLPDGADLYGVATSIDLSGRLQVKSRSDGSLTAVAAGDVTHLRYE